MKKVLYIGVMIFPGLATAQNNYEYSPYNQTANNYGGYNSQGNSNYQNGYNYQNQYNSQGATNYQNGYNYQGGNNYQNSYNSQGVSNYQNGYNYNYQNQYNSQGVSNYQNGYNYQSGNQTNSNIGNSYGGNYSVPLPNGTNYGYSTDGSNVAPINSAVGQPAEAVPTQLPPGPPVEREFQFERLGVPGIHVYKLKWPDSNRNLQTIEVYRGETGELLQNITIPQEELRLVYSEIVQPTVRDENNLADQIVDTIDFNFDNSLDLRLTKSWPYVLGEKGYYIWLYDKESDQYKLSPEISALKGPYPNAKLKQIESVTLTGWGGGEFIKNFYEIDGDGKLIVASRITNTIYDRTNLTFLRDIRTRVNGELQRVCKFIIPTEGKPKRLWGQKSSCSKYLVKGPPLRRR